MKINRLSSGSRPGLHGMFGVTAQQYHLRHCRIAAAIADRPEVPSDADGGNGPNAVAAAYAAKDAGGYLLVVEGAVPTVPTEDSATCGPEQPL